MPPLAKQRVKRVHRAHDDQAHADVQRQDEAGGEDGAGRAQRDAAFDVVGAGVEGIALEGGIGHQGQEGDPAEGAVGEEALGLLEAEGVEVEDQARTHHRAAAEAAAGAEMAVQDDVHAIEQDHRHQNLGGQLQDGVVLGLVVTVVPLGLQHGGRGLLAGSMVAQLEQQQHAACRHEQHRRFAEGIEGTVVQNHAGHKVDGAGFLDALFDVALRNFIIIGIVRLAEGGQGHHGAHQEEDDEAQNQHRREAVQPVDELDALVQRPFVNARIVGPLLLHQGGSMVVGALFRAGVDFAARLLRRGLVHALFNLAVQHALVAGFPVDKALPQRGAGIISGHSARPPSGV